MHGIQGDSTEVLEGKRLTKDPRDPEQARVERHDPAGSADFLSVAP